MKQPRLSRLKKRRLGVFRSGSLSLIGLPLLLLWAAPAWPGIEDIGPAAPYEAPDYEPPPPPESKVHLVDNGDGTLTQSDTKLMWARVDSYADLGKCLNWYESQDYVQNLDTAGYTDWRMPTLRELYAIYDNTKANNMAWDHNPKNPLALDEKFADGAAYWYWSSDHQFTKLTGCCAKSFYFVKGMVHVRRFTMCANGGVRAVRDLPRTPRPISRKP